MFLTEGSLRQCSVVFCQCFDEISTLVSLDLWPATLVKPTTVVSIPLLNFLVSLQHEGKVSLISFCDACWKSGWFDTKLKQCLNRFVKTESIDQFCMFRRALTNLKTACPSFTGFDRCAACPKKNGSVFYCLDGNFSLLLKTSSSNSLKLSSKADMFLPDEEVDKFINKYDETSKDKDCNNFQAGTNIRSKLKTKKLSVTGVFGMSCRHEFPKLFLNMRHGERLGYAVLLLNKLLEESQSDNLKVHVIYDIACVLKRHLVKTGTMQKFSQFLFGIPVFHSYGHTGDCQIEYSIRRLESFGLMDGELMERLWSYLRSFSTITKEMTFAHRTDLLCDALHHFGAMKMQKIGSTLLSLKEKARATVESCDSELNSILSGVPITVAEETIMLWKNEEDASLQSRKKNRDFDELDWCFLYYKKLKEYNREKSLILLCSKVADVSNHNRKMKRLHASLKVLETRHHIKKRWETASVQYTEQHIRFLKRSLKATLQQLYSRSSEKIMLLCLEKRYAIGSAIANRLSSKINKVCNEIRNLLASYNSSSAELSSSNNEISYDAALDVTSMFYKEIAGIPIGLTPGVPEHVKRICVQYLLRKLRAKEELVLVEEEMQNCIAFWEKQYSVLDQTFNSSHGGVKFLICKKMNEVSGFIQELRDVFSLEIVEEEDFCYETDTSSSSGEEQTLEEDFSFYV